MGVRCFDIDIVITADKQLLVTHPKALQVASLLHCSVRPAHIAWAVCKMEMLANVPCTRQNYAVCAVLALLLQAVLHQQNSLQSQEGLHLDSYSLAELRQVGANSTAFPSAAEVTQVCRTHLWVTC